MKNNLMVKKGRLRELNRNNTKKRVIIPKKVKNNDKNNER